MAKLESVGSYYDTVATTIRSDVAIGMDWELFVWCLLLCAWYRESTLNLLLS